MLKTDNRIKIIVFIGYVLLFIIAFLGLVKIYKEMVSLSKKDYETSEKRELNLVSNALLELYGSESVRKIAFFDVENPIVLPESYKEMDLQLHHYLDSLYETSTDVSLRLNIDTVFNLLAVKEQNYIKIFALMDTIRNIPKSKFAETTLLTQRDVSNLGMIVNDKFVEKQDTSFYVKEKRKFADRVRAVFVSKEDSTKVITSSSSVHRDSADYVPAQILTDTIVHFINDLNKVYTKKKVGFLLQLSSRQNQMVLYDQSITDQINTILKRIEYGHTEKINQLNAEKEDILKHSYNVVAVIAMISILILLVFLSISFFLININQRQKDKLEESNFYIRSLMKSKDRLLAMISHDVKAPLSSIIGHVEMMFRSGISEQDKGHLESMRNSSELILELSNQLIDFDRLEKGDQTLKFVPFVPFQLLKDIYNTFLPLAKRKKISLTLDNKLQPNAYFESDPFAIKQVLNNIVSNAVKFTHEGEVFISSLYNESSGKLEIIVKDSGVGIKDEDKEKIFQAYTRIGTTSEKLQIEGAGLGLQITEKLISALNGTVQVQSEFGVGTEFTLFIPLSKVEDKVETKKTAIKKITRKTTAKVLLVDDEATILSIYSRLLEQNGATVKICTNPQNVISLLRQNQFDIIFTDIQMPEKNGFQLIKEIRDEGGIYKKISVIALSARSDISEKEFLAAGFTSFLSKPVSFEKMEDIVFQSKSREKSEEKEKPIQSKELKSSSLQFENLIEFVKDDRNVSNEILYVFLKDSQEKLDDLKKSIENKDFDEIGAISHKLLPLMTMIGAVELLPVLERLEQGKKNEDDAHFLTKKLVEIIESAEVFIQNFQ